MTALGIDRYAIYRSGADLGVFVQAIADWPHGLRNYSEGGSHFLHHFSPILYLCAPLLMLFHSPMALIAVQACATALTAPAVFLLARRRLPEGLAVLVACVALLYPPLVGVGFTDFHENGFAPAALAWLVWAVDSRRWKLATLLVIAALAIKEDQAYLLGVLGAWFLWYSLRRRDRAGARFAGGAVVLSVAVGVCYFVIIRPLAGATQPWFALDYFTQHGAAAQHGVAALYGRLGYLLEALAPLAFVPLFSRWFLLTVPGLLEVLSSHWSITYTMGQHYAAVWIAFMLAAFASGLGTIARTSLTRGYVLAKIALGLCAVVLVFFSPTHWRHYLGTPNVHHRVLDRFVGMLPAAASAGTFDEVFTHVALDPNARIGLGGLPEYLLFDDSYDSGTYWLEYRPRIREWQQAGIYRALASEDGVTLYRRQPKAGTTSLGRAEMRESRY